MGLDLAGRTILEVGAGIGDHTEFFLDRGCKVTVTEGRAENLAVLRKRFPSLDVQMLDLDRPDPTIDCNAEIGYCYGTLYHLSRPAEGLRFLASRCSDLLLLETCVSPGPGQEINLVDEFRQSPSQAVSGRGCRPTRSWIYTELASHFAHVYMSRTQPWHPEFPLDWNTEFGPTQLTRAIFVASREPLHNENLSTEILDVQVRH